ncbi:unnamed protein product [Moneuplotes crassus]|uniref:Uncharacterized protein n=1 Tax=Euplotes crassus TaxID=5936 RepID=A0AAD1XQ20_EUPCR|nr:unnamed protein product [Moneuplotes crassus]
MEKALKWKGSNPLLSKDDVGKSKPCSYQLPQDGFAYGRPEKKDSEGAKEVTSSWAYHQQSRVTSSKKDFLSMNKSGATDSRDFKVSAEPKHKGKKAAPPPDMIYGMMNRPSTPIEGVISNTYGTYAEQESEENYKKMTTKPKIKKKVPGIRTTKAEEKKMEFQKTKKEGPVSSKADDFKIKRFTKVESRVKAELKKSKKPNKDIDAGPEEGKE